MWQWKTNTVSSTFCIKVAVRERIVLEQQVWQIHSTENNHVPTGFTFVFVEIQLHYLLPLLLQRSHLHSEENKEKDLFILLYVCMYSFLFGSTGVCRALCLLGRCSTT
jgi:hypothetical protein